MGGREEEERKKGAKTTGSQEKGKEKGVLVK